MNYRKFKADYLFDGHSIIAEESVLVTDTTGVVEAILPRQEAGDGIEVFEGILSPGLINCHCHLELSHMKGLIPEKTGLVDFLISVIFQRNADLDIILDRIAQAEDEMLANGIVAVGDICNNTHTLLQKKQGRIWYHNFIEALGFAESAAPDRFQEAKKFYDQFAGELSFPANRNSIVPHAPYSVSLKLFDLLASFPENKVLTIHNQEDEAENEWYRSGQGDFSRLYRTLGIDTSDFVPQHTSSLVGYLPHFHSEQSMILVHDVATTASDLQFCSQMQKVLPKLFFCICPNANLYISERLPDIDLFLKNNLDLVMGTDSLASNHQLSILEELKTLQLHFPNLPTECLLQWAVSNGARALHLEEQLGDFKIGKKPGVILIDQLEGKNFTSRSKVSKLI